MMFAKGDEEEEKEVEVGEEDEDDFDNLVEFGGGEETE